MASNGTSRSSSFRRDDFGRTGNAASNSNIATSPATGANALPASPPLGRHLGPFNNPYSSYLTFPHRTNDLASRVNVNLPARSGIAASMDRSDFRPVRVQADFSTLLAEPPIEDDSPPASAALLDANPVDKAPPKKQTSAAAATASSSLKAFPVPTYLLHSVFSPRMFTVAGPSTLTIDANPDNAIQKSLLFNSPSSRSRALPPALSDRDWAVALPTCWNPDDRCTLVEVSADGLNVSFCGSGKNGDRDAAAVRANRPMPSHCGVYYFEVEIVSKGQSGYIGIGFSAPMVSLSRLPGWEAQSWGYHGDDGNSFASRGTGRAYGPTFTTGDVVGCGIDFTRNQAFFTKNGAFLGYVFSNLRGHLYPSVGLRTPGEVVRGNFGQQERFRFDIDQFVRDRKQSILRHIDTFSVPTSYVLEDAATPPPPPEPSASEEDPTPHDLTHTIAELISSYLVFHGYADTANAFETQRTETKEFYSAGLAAPFRDDDPNLPPNGHANGDIDDAEGEDEFEITVRQKICSAILHGEAEVALAMAQDHFPTALETGTIEFSLRCQAFVELVRAMVTKPSDAMDVDDSEEDARTRAIDCGRRLDADYAHDKRPEIRPVLLKTFGLLAYANPMVDCPDLAGQAARERIAEAVNSAILTSQGKSSRPVLELVYKQATATIGELGRQGVGQAAFIDVGNVFSR